MKKEDLMAALEAISKSGIKVAGDLVLEKHVEHEVANVEAGGIGILINNGQTAKEVKSKAQQDKKGSELPEWLASENAKKYWSRLQEADLVDADYQLIASTTRKQAMYIAELFAERMGIKSKWKTFEQLWGISNLAQEKWDMQETGTTPQRSKEIDRIFAD